MLLNVVDKTGTLTTGRAVVGSRIEYVSQIVKSDKMSLKQMLQSVPPAVKQTDIALWFACCAELWSEHPLGHAILNSEILSIVEAQAASKAQYNPIHSRLKMMDDVSSAKSAYEEDNDLTPNTKAEFLNALTSEKKSIATEIIDISKK